MFSKKSVCKLPSHAYIRPLVAEDLDQCVELEIAGFQPDQRASREKVSYMFFFLRPLTNPDYCLHYLF